MLLLLLPELTRGTALTPEQIEEAVGSILDPAVAPAEKAEFLAAFAIKGETTGEIHQFAEALRRRSIHPPISERVRLGEIVDVCGTGGDRLGTFNISTAVSLVLSAEGVRVAKHGNRAVSSAAGSADVLEELGIPIELSPEEAAAALEQRSFAFFFAPNYHPAFRHAAPARKLCAERGQRTIFNLLGPLLNPARPTAQLVGVPGPQWCEPIGRVLQSMGLRRGMAVCGAVPPDARAAAAPGAAAGQCYLDELSTLGPSWIAEFYQERGFSQSQWQAEGIPLAPAALSDLAGSDRKGNAEILRRIFSGSEQGPRRDAVLLNTGAALLVSGRVRSIAEGWERAAELIDSGRVERKLRELAG